MNRFRDKGGTYSTCEAEHNPESDKYVSPLFSMSTTHVSVLLTIIQTALRHEEKQVHERQFGD